MTDSGKMRILVALDYPRLASALEIVAELKDVVGGFKVGLELCTADGVKPVVDQVSRAGGSVFLDLKFKDIPNTVAGAVRSACVPGVFMVNVHCDGGLEMMKAAVKARSEAEHKPLLIGVTVLTSISDAVLNHELGVARTVADQVKALAQMAAEAGLDGVVCSPQEVAMVKQVCGRNFLTVVPGVRPAWAATGDQKRVATPAETVKAGADYLVIGRPITAPPKEIGSPKEAAILIVSELDEALGVAQCR